MTYANTEPVRSTRAPLRWTGHVLLVACWILVVVMGLLTWAPHATRFKTDIIIGQSMEPTIPLWSVIVVEPVDPSRIRPGDVIVAEPQELGNQKVTHRVVDVQATPSGEPQFRTRGDNNETTDPWTVTYADDAYRVVHHVPHVGWIMAKAQTRLARLLLIVLPVLLLLHAALRWIWKDTSTDQDADTEADPWHELGLGETFDEPRHRETLAG